MARIFACPKLRMQKAETIIFPTSDRTRLPAEFKHITKRRKRN